jgi:hypothetical protein
MRFLSPGTIDDGKPVTLTRHNVHQVAERVRALLEGRHITVAGTDRPTSNSVRLVTVVAAESARDLHVNGLLMFVLFLDDPGREWPWDIQYEHRPQITLRPSGLTISYRNGNYDEITLVD